jgi:hypothetical protein
MVACPVIAAISCTLHPVRPAAVPQPYASRAPKHQGIRLHCIVHETSCQNPARYTDMSSACPKRLRHTSPRRSVQRRCDRAELVHRLRFVRFWLALKCRFALCASYIFSSLARPGASQRFPARIDGAVTAALARNWTPCTNGLHATTSSHWLRPGVAMKTIAITSAGALLMKQWRKHSQQNSTLSRRVSCGTVGQGRRFAVTAFYTQVSRDLPTVSAYLLAQE